MICMNVSCWITHLDKIPLTTRHLQDNTWTPLLLYDFWVVYMNWIRNIDLDRLIHPKSMLNILWFVVVELLHQLSTLNN